MDNLYSPITLVTPELPSNFEALAGTSKTDLIKAAFAILEQAKIEGVNPTQPTVIDIGQLASQIESLAADVAALMQVKPVAVTVSGVTNDIVIVVFPDIGTDVYKVQAICRGANASFTANLMIIDGTKKSNQFQMKVTGAASGYFIDVLIFPNI